MTRVYAAEHEAFGAREASREHGITIEQAREIVARHTTGWMVERGKSRYGGSHANMRTRRIVLGHTAGLPIVLHETAHALTGHGHGAAFQIAYVRLVEQEMGPYWSRRLRASLRRHKPRGYVTALRMTA